jgi:hypothetical protein
MRSTYIRRSPLQWLTRIKIDVPATRGIATDHQRQGDMSSTRRTGLERESTVAIELRLVSLLSSLSE